jgi:hypothetical protein
MVSAVHTNAHRPSDPHRQRGRVRLHENIVLGAERPAHARRHDPDPAVRQSHRCGDGVPDPEGALARRPDRDASVGLHPRRGHVRLQVALVEGGHTERPHHDDIRRRHRGLGISFHEVESARYVREQAPVRIDFLGGDSENSCGGIGLRGRLGIEHGGQDVVVDRDHVDGVARSRPGLCDHGRNLLPLVTHFIGREERDPWEVRRGNRIDHTGAGKGR